MKTRNHLIRIITLIIIGAYLIYQFYQLKFSSFLWREFLLGIVIFIGLSFWIWLSFKDFKLYKSTRKRRFLIGPILGAIFSGLIIGISLKNKSEFNKPTLVRAYYDGDFNGTSIDFKTDGTYIFDNHAIGFSEYVYGKYKINGQSIKLDRNEIENVIKTDQLEIKEIAKDGIDYLAGAYIFQIETNGNEIERATKFRVVEDNRK